MQYLKLKYLSAVVITLVLTASLSAQKTPADSVELSRQVASLYQAGKFDEAIPLADRIVDIEKSKSSTSDTYATALTNLGLLHKERMRRLQKQIPSGTLEEGRRLAPKLAKDAEKAEENFREAFDVYVRRNESDGLEAALVRNELAWVINNYLATRTTADSRARIDEAEKLFTEALAIREKKTALDSDVVLQSLLTLGDFYLRWINFEKALPYYERYISTVEKRSGPTAKELVPALRGILETQVVTMQDDEARDLAKRIASITGKDEPVPTTLPRLALRARKTEKLNTRRFIPGEMENDPRALFNYVVGGGLSMSGITTFRRIVVKIVVDESGKVIDAKIADPNVPDAEEIEKSARMSEFRPFIYNGVARKMRGAMVYTYVTR